MPKDTKWLSWGGFVNWHTWCGEHKVPSGRYDLLMDLNLVDLHTKEKRFQRITPLKKLSDAGDSLMIDMEHPELSPSQLRVQPWFPKGASERKQKAFAKRYFDGYAQTYVSAIQAARAAGWKNISIYGWTPFGRTWGGLEKPQVDPGSDHAWNAFGSQIYDEVDLVHNSVYCFYWSPQNVAYTLASIDANKTLIDSKAKQKPLRPYYWTLLHGGGGGWRWWLGQPIPSEEKRAMIAMGFFTGIDGFDTWNWSGTGNHHRTAIANLAAKKVYFSSGNDVMLKHSLECVPENKTEPETFHRCDVLHLHKIDPAAGTVRFQKVKPARKNYGVTDAEPYFTVPIKNLEPQLRAKSEPVGAMIEGMALVKPFEYTLRNGEVKFDVPSRKQFKETLPIVRRIKNGKVHIIATYDPKVIYGNAPRQIKLKDFDGRVGMTLRLPADGETRIFLLRE